MPYLAIQSAQFGSVYYVVQSSQLLGVNATGNHLQLLNIEKICIKIKIIQHFAPYGRKSEMEKEGRPIKRKIIWTTIGFIIKFTNHESINIHVNAFLFTFTIDKNCMTFVSKNITY